MKKKLTFTLLVLLGSLFFNYERAEACSCSVLPHSVAAFKETPFVFVGKVKSVELKTVKVQFAGEQIDYPVSATAKIEVVEALKGVKEKEVTIATGGGGGDCGFGFDSGETYLIFAYPNNSENENVIASSGIASTRENTKTMAALATSICTRSNLLKNATDDVELIRAFLKGTPEARIYGVVREYSRRFNKLGDPEYIGGMAGVTVRAEGAAGKFEAKTDGEGRYSLKNLPLGKYKVSLVLPPTHTMLYDFADKFRNVEFKTKEDSKDVNFSTQIEARIGGRVYDWQGKPVGDQVQVSLVTSESAGKPLPEMVSRSEWTDASGKFEFDGVKPGKYIVGVSVAESPYKQTPYPKTFSPGGSDVSKAAVVKIDVGQKLTGFDIRLPKPLETFAVEGFVFLADGKPAVDVEVDIYDSETPYEQVFGFSHDIKTDARGRFQITGFKGRRYLLHAYKDENYLAGTGIQSEPVEVLFDETAKNVKLILNKPGIFRQRPKKDSKETK